MPVEKLFKKLNDYLDKGERKKKAHCERIDGLLDKLNEKAKDFEGQLEQETDPDARKRLKIELKIVQAHLAKARLRREDLEIKCK